MVLCCVLVKTVIKQMDRNQHSMPSNRSPVVHIYNESHDESRNNWSVSDEHTCPAHMSAQALDADTESNCWHLYAAQTNSRLLHVLSDLVKTFLDTENAIQKQLEEMGIETNNGSNEDVLQGFASLVEDNIERLSESNDLCEDGPDLTPSSNLMYLTPPSTYMSGQNEIELEDDVVLGASRRLRSAVDRILKLLSEIVAAHQEHDFNSLLKRNVELISELNEECTRRDKLTTQLLQIEERVKVLEKEKISLSSQMADYNEAKLQMETLKIKVNEYESEREKWVSDNKRLEKEKCSFAQGLPQLQQKLISDNETLITDVRQLQQEKVKLLQRIHALTVETEQLRSERDETIERKNHEHEDFVAQIEANEKNLTSYRRFIDEQTHERELERDEFNKELTNLMEKLKEKDKCEAKLHTRLEELENQMSSLSDEKCNKEKHLSIISSQLKNADQEISELKDVINQMERESDKYSQLERQLRSKVNDLNDALDLQIKINEETQNDDLTNSILERITSKTHELQSTLGPIDCESESEDTSIDYSYSDVKQLSEKLNALNDCINKLLVQNSNLKAQLERNKVEISKDCVDIIKEKENLERNLLEMKRSNEILQKELNSKHLQLSSLKSRLEANVDSSELKHLIEELQTKLIAEEQKSNSLGFQIVNLKQQLDDKNNKTMKLIDEVNALKRLNKTIDSEKLSFVRENEDLKFKLSSHEAKQSSEEQKRNALDYQIINLKQEIDEKNAKIIKMSDELNSLINQTETVTKEKLILVCENDELRLKLSSKDAILHSVRQNNDDRTVDTKHFTEQIETFKVKLNFTESEKMIVMNENEELKIRLNTNDHILNSLKQQIKDYHSRELALVEKIDLLTNKLEFYDSDVRRVNKENIEMQTKYANLSSELLDEINSLKYQLKQLELERDRLLKENAELRAKLSLYSTDDANVLHKKQNEEKDKFSHFHHIVDGINFKVNKLESDAVDSPRRQVENKHLNFVNKNSTILCEKQMEDEKVQTMLWKLKRVVSHKTALIYQKKYLLHVLGGFQLTEKATLALLANMNVTVDEELPAYRSGRNKFRSAVYAVIAISRLKFLSNRWKHVYKSKSSLRTISSNSLGTNCVTTESQTNSTLQEFVNRLQLLHDTLGLRSAQM